MCFPICLESLQVTVRAPGAFRKDEHAFALCYAGCGGIQTLHGIPAVRAVNRDVADPVHGPAKDRQAEEFLLGQPAEVVGEIALKREDVELARMVAGKDVGLFGVDMFEPLHPDLYAGKPADGPAPPAGKLLGLPFGTPYPQHVDEGQQGNDKNENRGKAQREDAAQ